MYATKYPGFLSESKAYISGARQKGLALDLDSDVSCNKPALGDLVPPNAW